ncbi:MAG: hypothetical protein ABW217_21885 [Polyangiaceae bacterium]
MGRWLGVCARAAALLAAALLASNARAEDFRARRPVVVIAPAPGTCVLIDPLLVGIMNAGPYFASLVPANSVPETIPAATFQLEGTPAALHLRAWGLGWPMGERPTRPEVDHVIGAQSCETMTEAVVAQIVSLLAPDDGGFDTLLVTEPSAEPSSTLDPRALERVLDDARRQIAAHPTLSAGVFVTPLGLELAVQDERARCRRATWLSTASGAPELGMSVAALTQAVDACVQALPPDAAPPTARTSAPDRGAFHFALLTGALAASVGLINGLVVEKGSTSTTTALVYGVTPPVLGGLGSYLVPERWSEPVLLTGYWLGIAGTSLVVATDSGAKKTLLIGGSLAAGSATSAALALVNGMIGEPAQRMPAWAVATPAVVGAGLGVASLAIDGRGRHSASLALLGGAAASLPALWLAGVAIVENLQEPTVDVAVSLDEHGSPGLLVNGEF